MSNTEQLIMLTFIQTKNNVLKIFFLTFFALINFSFHADFYNPPGSFLNTTDTTVIKHDLDGSIQEWPAQKFESNTEIGIKYAVDNDNENLYIAMSIPSFPAQMKIMSQGMILYIDTKGKQSEEKGIEYPVRSENPPAVNSQDKNAIRAAMAMNLIFLKLFGFSEGAPVKQTIEEGKVNIVFGWDAADVMNIEYKIPLAVLVENSLDQKLISLGFKIQGREMMAQTVGMSGSSRIVSVQSGRRPMGTGRRPQTPTGSSPNFDQSFWTKYTMAVHAK